MQSPHEEEAKEIFNLHRLRRCHQRTYFQSKKIKSAWWRQNQYVQLRADYSRYLEGFTLKRISRWGWGVLGEIKHAVIAILSQLRQLSNGFDLIWSVSMGLYVMAGNRATSDDRFEFGSCVLANVSVRIHWIRRLFVLTLHWWYLEEKVMSVLNSTSEKLLLTEKITIEKSKNNFSLLP